MSRTIGAVAFFQARGQNHVFVGPGTALAMADWHSWRRSFGFTADELELASLNALRASFLPADEKARMEREFMAEFARLRAECHSLGSSRPCES